MRAGIIQSCYIPWRGYFDLIDDVDIFIFCDDLRYNHQNWRNRNRIKTREGPRWLSVPVIHNHETLIQDAKIDYSQRWVAKHVGAIRLAYAKAPYFSMYAEEFFELLHKSYSTISELNVTLTKWVMLKLQISTKTYMSSEFLSPGYRDEKTVQLVQAVGCDVYLSGPAARTYIDPTRFEHAGITLEYKSYNYRDYPQQHGAFEPQMTILDLLFNCGPDSRSHIKSFSPAEVAVDPT